MKFGHLFANTASLLVLAWGISPSVAAQTEQSQPAVLSNVQLDWVTAGLTVEPGLFITFESAASTLCPGCGITSSSSSSVNGVTTTNSNSGQTGGNIGGENTGNALNIGSSGATPPGLPSSIVIPVATHP